MAYELQSMLRIRGMREEKAQTELAVARAATRAAESVLENKKDIFRKYEIGKEERRDKVFDTVMGRVVSRDELDTAREAVTKIDEEGVLLKQDEDKAEQVVVEKTNVQEMKHAAYNAAAKEKAKIEEHRKMWEEEDRKMREALADAEMEEFAGRKVVADDDDTFD